ncbi:MAG TPA: single-stranded-DNA-specific exonuclease RecJ, partial [Fimbriimonas sp.]
MARWVIDERNREAEARLVKELGISSLVAAVLAQRGITEPADADRFLHPRLDDLHSPASLPDYQSAISAILGAKERKELIYVHGDYDVDGITSASIFTRFLRAIGCEVKVHVPHRMKEGYGIHLTAVDDAISAGAKLFLTCDCGSGALEQIEKAREAGMTVVVTDHHSIGECFPNAHAFVNPHRTDSNYPFAELSGAGVAFKICEGITQEIGFKLDSFYRAYLDLAALGTIADVMPLRGENRIIARFGLERLADTKKAGLQALKEVAGLEAGKPVRAYHVGFVLGPRLNATGRIDDAATALKLLMTTDANEARSLALQIEQFNIARRAEQDRIIEEAVQMVVETQSHLKNVIVVSNPGWHTGLVGIVAGRLVDMFHRPVFVLNEGEDGRCKGSARTIPGFDLADAIRSFPDLMEGGGHAMAAGCSFPLQNLSDVQQSLH